MRINTLFIAVALFICATVAVSQNPAGRPGASVEGYVTDTDSGLVSFARVTLTPQVGGAAINSDTNGEGKFQLGNVASGRYTVAVSKTGFIRSARGLLNITLNADQQLKNVRLELARASVITGRVLDLDQRPVSSATVIALKRRYNNGHELLLPPRAERDWYPGSSSVPPGIGVQTGPEGDYRLFGLEPGDYYIGVWNKLDNGMESFTQPQYYPGVVDPDLAAPLSVQLGRDQLGMDIHISNQPRYRVQFKAVVAPCAYETKDFGRARMFSVVRQSLGGLRVPIGMHWRTDRVPVLPGRPFPPSATATSFMPADDSTWISPPLYRGTYEIFYTSCYMPGVNDAADVGHLTVSLVDRDIDSAIMDVREAVSLRGNVVAASGLSDRFNLRGLRVALMDLDDRTTALLPSGGVFQGSEPLLTLKDGTIDIPHLPMGRYAIGLLSGPTRLPPDVYVASVRIGGHEVRETGFDLDGNIDSLEIRLEANGGTIEGVVHNSKQEPVTSAQVVLIPPAAQRNNVTLFKTASLDQNGMFLIQGIPPGDYQLFAWERVDPGDFQNPDFLKAFEGRAAKVRVERGSRSIERLSVIPSN